MSKRASILIPAYNEAGQIEAVLRPLASLPEDEFEIIVIDDGSTDNTAQKAREFPGVEVISHPKNKGKTSAIATGFSRSSAPVIVLLDADLIGFQPSHLLQMITPIERGDTEAVVGLFRKGRFSTDFAHRIAPSLSGQRAFSRSLLQQFPFEQYAGYQLERSLERWLTRRGISPLPVPLFGVSQKMKEEKMGVLKGILCRMKMYCQIVKGEFRSAVLFHKKM
ncbi:MAG: glycosyltransferase family 2 protein [bacterium JZ-2024 1]